MDGIEKNVKGKQDFFFLQYLFILSMSGIERLQCVNYCEVLSAESMEPNKLKFHLDSKHLSLDTNCVRNKADRP